MTVNQSSLGFWYIFLGGDVIGGGTLDKQSAIEEMELLK
tara:strand:- start:504 stop:620 length:117 start_codon:yes stop_codon:yes gene_type:complete